MTLREYVIEHDAGAYALFERGGYDALVWLLFWSKTQPAWNSDNNYTPFDYSDETGDEYGGTISREIAYYIAENYLDHDLNDLYLYYHESQSGLEISALKSKIAKLQQKYKYKWHGIYESILLDSEYSPLDNVNEISSETTTRTPNLLRTKADSQVYGSKQQDTTDNLGAMTSRNTNVYGQRKENSQHEMPQRTNTTDFTKGDVTTTENVTTYPYDDATEGAPLEKRETSIGQDPQVPDHTEVKEGSYTERNTSTQNAVTDNLTNTIDAVQNKQSVVDASHTDTHSGTESETGNEVTTYQKLRHGNIGVTTSGQLLADWRDSHNFQIVPIIANDIINEILDLNWN